MTFYVGQKVVFVPDALIHRPRGNMKWPAAITADRVLTIREIDTRYVPHYGVCGLRFEEFCADFVRYGRELLEPAFPSDRFRPIVEKKTDISIFTALLTPNSKERVKA